MRLTFLLSSLRLSGGVLLVLELANELARRGHSIVLVYPRCPIDEFLVSRTHPQVEHRLAAPLRQGLSLFSLVYSMVRTIPRGDVIVATHTPTTVPGWIASRLGRRGHLVWLYMDYPLMFQHRPLEAWLLQHMPVHVDGIAAISQPLLEKIRTQAPEHSHFIGAGLPGASRIQRWLATELGENATAPRGNEELRVLYIGDSRPRKGLDDFLEAMQLVWQTHPQVKAVIVSKEHMKLVLPGPYELHHCPDEDRLYRLYRTATIFVSTSWSEGLGYPPLEAMALGVPAVITDSYGVRDYAHHERNCLLVPPRRPREVAAAILRLLHDRALRQMLVTEGQRTVSRYRWDTMADRFERVVQSLV